jgi:hypothetical protein
MRMGVVRIGSLGIPAAPKTKCVDRRRFRFKLHGRVVKVEVFVNGVRKAMRKGHFVRSVSIRKLPKRRFVVRVVSTFANGSKRESVRTYKGCNKSKPRTRRR